MPSPPPPKAQHSSPVPPVRIGRALGRSRLTAVVAGTVAVLVLACDLTLAWIGEMTDMRRAILSVVALCTLGGLAKWDWPSLGLGLRVQPNLRYWLKATVVIGALVLLFCVIVFTAIWFLAPATVQEQLWGAPSDFWRWIPHACLVTPLLEETIYRFTLCMVGVALLGRWPTIVLSGLLFAGLHVAYGNPSPENFIAGFVLAWAYVKSENLLVPIALHSMGNLVVGLWNLGCVVLGG